MQNAQSETTSDRIQSTQNDAIKTSQKIANQYNVSKATVERAEKFVEGLGNITLSTT